MKKAAFTIALALVLVGAAMGAMALVANGLTGPTLTVTGSGAPGSISIVGSNWLPGVRVDLYMDMINEAHHVAVATPVDNGSFISGFVVGPTTLGVHQIIGIQNATQVTQAFRLTRTQQVDDRIWGVLQGIDTEVDNIESKLDNPTYGLRSIAIEVYNIESKLDNPTYGLQGIATEVDNIEAKLDNPTYGLQSNLARFEADSWFDGLAPGESTGSLVEYDEIRHVSVTLWTAGDDPDYEVEIRLPMGLFNPAVFATNNNGVYSFEFDARAWQIAAANNPGATEGLSFVVLWTSIYALAP